MIKHLTYFLLLLSCGWPTGYTHASAPPTPSPAAATERMLNQQLQPIWKVLPDDLWVSISSYLSFEDLIKGLFLVSKKFQEYAKNPVVWRLWEVEIGFILGDEKWLILKATPYQPPPSAQRFRCRRKKGLLINWVRCASYIQYKTFVYNTEGAGFGPYTDMSREMSGLVLINHAQKPPIWELSVLENRPTPLQYLCIMGKIKPKDYSRLGQCSALRTLRLEMPSSLGHIDFLLKLTQLTKLDLWIENKSEIQINSWEPLGQCTKLTHLALALALADDWERLWPLFKGLQKLEFISLTHLGAAAEVNILQLSYAGFAQSLNGLQLINWGYEDMSSLTPLKDYLRLLSCGRWENLTTLKHLKGFKVLETLEIINCPKLKTLKGVASLKCLHKLVLGPATQVAVVDELTAPQAFAGLREVYYGYGLLKEHKEHESIHNKRPKLLVDCSQNRPLHSGIHGYSHPAFPHPYDGITKEEK